MYVICMLWYIYTRINTSADEDVYIHLHLHLQMQKCAMCQHSNAFHVSFILYQQSKAKMKRKRINEMEKVRRKRFAYTIVIIISGRILSFKHHKIWSRTKKRIFIWNKTYRVTEITPRIGTAEKWKRARTSENYTRKVNKL